MRYFHMFPSLTILFEALLNIPTYTHTHTHTFNTIFCHAACYAHDQNACMVIATDTSIYTIHIRVALCLCTVLTSSVVTFYIYRFPLVHLQFSRGLEELKLLSTEKIQFCTIFKMTRNILRENFSKFQPSFISVLPLVTIFNLAFYMIFFSQINFNFNLIDFLYNLELTKIGYLDLESYDMETLLSGFLLCSFHNIREFFMSLSNHCLVTKLNHRISCLCH